MEREIATRNRCKYEWNWYHYQCKHPCRWMDKSNQDFDSSCAFTGWASRNIKCSARQKLLIHGFLPPIEGSACTERSKQCSIGNTEYTWGPRKRSLQGHNPKFHSKLSPSDSQRINTQSRLCWTNNTPGHPYSVVDLVLQMISISTPIPLAAVTHHLEVLIGWAEHRGNLASGAVEYRREKGGYPKKRHNHQNMPSMIFARRP